jgi:sn-glycerol 3-phosphate transport system ATP-binding protein
MGRAIIREPKVFLFDEPLSNLDAKLRVAMRAEIRRLHRRSGATAVFVTHDQVEAMTLADRLVVMNAGRVEQFGTPSEVYNRPASRFVANFVGTPPMNLMEGTIERPGTFVYDESRRVSLPPRFAGLPAGQRIVLGVRPEALRLVDADTPGAILATVDFVEELGAGRVVHTDLDGLPFAVATGDAVPPEMGETLGLLIDPEAVHLFSAETGLRLDTTSVAASAVRVV